MIKTIFFILFIYFVIRAINRMFFPASRQRRSNGFFYSNFQSNRQQQQQSRTETGGKKNFDQIEEADYEDITDKAETNTEESDRKDRS